MLILLFESLSIIPGETKEIKIASQSEISLNLTHQQQKYAFQTILESPNSIQITGYVCLPSSDFNTCKQQQDSKFIRTNSRMTINLTTGSYQVFIKNFDTKEVTIYFTYDDSFYLLPNLEYNSKPEDSEIVFRVPVCSDVQNMQILTNANASNIFYSFENGIPTTSGLPLKDIQPRYPGFMYIKVTQKDFQINVVQYDRNIQSYDAVSNEKISSFFGCQRVYQFLSGQKGQQITIVGSETDNLSDKQIQMFYLDNFDGHTFPTQQYYDERSFEGVLVAKFTNDQVSTSIVSLEMPQRIQYLPNQIKVSQLKYIYNYQLYITITNQAILPGRRLNYSLTTGQQLVVAIPFKYSEQAYQSTGEANSNYLVRMIVKQQPQTGDTTLQFGHGNVNDSSFVVNKLETADLTYESVARYENQANYIGDIFFGTINCKTECSGTFVAEHSFILKDRTPLIYNHVEYEGDPDYYFATYFVKQGMDLDVQTLLEDVTIYISTIDQLPTLKTRDVRTYTCKSREYCTINISSSEINNQQVYISIKARNSVVLTAASQGENIDLLTEGKTLSYSIVLGDEDDLKGHQYLFKPQIQNITHNDQQWLHFSLELKNIDLLSMPYDLNLMGLISINSNPSYDNYIETFSILDGSYQNDRTIIQVKIPYPNYDTIYCKIFCEGADCLAATEKIKILRYDLTLYSMIKVTSQLSNKDLSLNFPVKNTSTYGFFMMESNEYSILNFSPNQEKSCSQLKYNLTICFSMIPSDNYDQDDCIYEDITSQQKYIHNIDLFNQKYQSGNVYIQVKLDLSDFTESINVIQYCQSTINLKQFKRIMPQSTLTLSGLQQLYASIPVISNISSTADSVGDRIVIKGQGCSFTVCVNDDITTQEYAENDCINAKEISHANETFVVDFKHFKNSAAVGKLQSHTNIFVTFNSECPVQLTLRGQSVIEAKSLGLVNTFTYQHYYGNQYYLQYAIKTSDINVSASSLHVGPFCNSSFCRSETLPEQLQEKSLITTISSTELLPNNSNSIFTYYNKGVQIIPLINHTGNWLYVTLSYRYGYLLTKKNQRSEMPFTINLLENYGSQNTLEFQSLTSVVKTGDASKFPIDFYNQKLAYIPSQLAVFPCKGRPVILQDYYTPRSIPMYKDYQQILSQPYGRPIFFTYGQNDTQGLESFISIFDYNKYDFQAEKFVSNDSKMEYEVYFGSAVREIRPGNAGKITIVNFDAKGDGSITIRFYPASVSFSHDKLSSLDYQMYAVPYQGSIDEENDYSPYTKCGVTKIGYPLFVDPDNKRPYIDYNEKEVISKGYIEVTSNQNLFPANVTVTNIYVTVIVGQTVYEGVMAGSHVIAQSSLIFITLAIVVAIIVALFLVFFILVVRLRRQQQTGYKHITT